MFHPLFQIGGEVARETDAFSGVGVSGATVKASAKASARGSAAAALRGEMRRRVDVVP
jgi:hypothetical protein